MENRIERLEAELAMQDHTIEKLHDAIYDQQKKLDSLETQVQTLLSVVKEMKESLSSGDMPRDEPPPHYGR